MSSFRAPALRACALAAGITLLGGASAQAAERVTASKAVARSCHDRYVGATRSTDVSRTIASSTGLVRARLAGRGDWDVAVFDAKTRRNVAGSAGFGSSELAEGFVRKGQRLLVQACRYRGGAKGAKLSVSFLGIEGDAKAAAAGGKIQVVDVATRDRAGKERLQGLGLDLTEHGDADSVEVVLHDAADEQKLRDAGFSFDVRIADLVARTKANRAADRRFAAQVEQTALPSGRTTYRRLADYELEMKQLAARYPSLVKPVTLAETTLEGRPVNGIEITRNADDTRDGKPVFLQLGVHHAREWPSSEHAMEFGYDLLTNYGKSARTTRLVNATRTIVVPIVNVDGFNLSREAPDDSGSGFAYKRRNCRVVDGQTPAPGACGLQVNRNKGVDPNRNYGGLWGGPGASFNPNSDTYRGAGPFSEPETRNIQKLVSSRQVTNLITNHTYSNLVLRPPGLVAQGPPIDEPAYRALGERMTDHNLYANMPSYGLYDTSGTTEDWSYYATGGWGFTFEIGPDEFHPPFEQGVVNEYLGRGDVVGAGKGGNREAYYEMLESTADAGMHSLLTGKAPKGSTITLRKQFQTKTSPVIGPGGTTSPPLEFTDTLTSSYTVPTNGKVDWHVNPSTRPIVAGKPGREPAGPPTPTFALTNPAGTPPPDPSSKSFEDVPFTVPETGPNGERYDNGRLTAHIEWANAAQDWDIVLLRNGRQVAGSAAGGTTQENAVYIDPEPGEYVLRVINWDSPSSGTPDWSGSVSFQSPTPAVAGTTEAYDLTCTSPGGAVTDTRQVFVGRGERYDLGKTCGKKKH